MSLVSSTPSHLRFSHSISTKNYHLFHFILLLFAGCYHNGTIFGNGSVVPSVEPCLLCKCVEKSLKCGLRICPQQLVPPPRNCILVHRKNFCCPYLLCTKYHNGPESLYGNNDQRIIDYNINNNHNKKRPDDDDGPEQRIIHENSLFRRLDDNIDDYDENDINGIYGNDNGMHINYNRIDQQSKNKMKIKEYHEIKT